ncbi:HET-domain-containing protein [Trichoderma citrinoviride]|uniref:HET-domain-containing protein n=1 Tax=Trichoderma citrinoviride TaxID=58853 RepID=A0A2T4BBW2_9HYPO|nr:HET-domain-containing protein [Trichoderma citrinoviride]PTB66814.1 HET-domain-containing protein [Trichoderma citrinoviride]
MAKVVRRRPLRRDVQSNKVFAAAKGLIKKCMSPKNPHKHCQYSRDTVLPLRVLDVGEPEDPRSTVKAKVNEIPQRVLDVDKPEDPHSTVKAKVNEIPPLTFDVDYPGDPRSMVRLKVNETDTHAPYLALSYCWGKQPTFVRKKPLQLRKNNIKSLKGGIKLHDLQKSIQDAIFATRKLGYRYLWVDALCIIQNCKIDKEREIGRMASIYKNASITIAAATSSNAEHGFLSKKLRPYCPQHEVHVRMAENTTGTVYLSTEPYEPDHPLDKRGWTLQEFMLSSRMLIFSDYELLWQCKEIDLCSVSAKGLEYLQPLETLPWTVFDDDAEPYYGNLDSDKVYLWKTIVQQYTNRQLSYTGDKLNAIMGITSELEALWRDTNIYGLWKKWFIELLAWYKPEMEREERRHLDRAPSWSWASLDGVILYEGSLSTEDARLKSLTVQAAELSCRILRESDVTDEKARTIAERPDLLDPVAELQQNRLKHGKSEYLLLGTVKSNKETEEGVGLLVIDTGRGVHQRLGFVKFHDMTIWEGVQRRGVILDSRVDKKKEDKEGKKKEDKEGKKREKNKTW